MKTLTELTQELTALGISPELAQVAAAKQYAALLEAEEAAQAKAQAAADEAAGVDLWCGVRCSGISYTGKDEKGNAVKVINPGLKGAKALEDGIGLEPAKPGATPAEGKPVYYAPKLWIMRKGKAPAAIGQYDLAGIVEMMDKHGAEKVVSLIREVASPEAVAKFNSDKAAGIADGRYQDTNNKKNRKK
jgi:hypothetical protein